MPIADAQPFPLKKLMMTVHLNCFQSQNMLKLPGLIFSYSCTTTVVDPALATTASLQLLLCQELP